ncbi:MAG: glycoside hydrolase family 25 protein [Kurthia sp.]|nr:glycoside hydrolase family 25 protein [Candidatus Kurthia equi]
MKRLFLLSLALVSIAIFGFTQNSQAKEYENTAKPESTVPWEYNGTKQLQTQSANSPVIADISKWQGNINWEKASKALDLVIIRTQDGISNEDYMHRTYEHAASKYNVPFGVYAFVRAGTPTEARKEARTFYNRASKNTEFYVLDVEVKTNKKGHSMRSVVEAYVNELNKHTSKKIGLYVANHLYSSFNLKTSSFNFVWIPRYSSSAPQHNHQLWQYTSRGSVPGISGNVDLNRLADGTKLEYFTNKLSTVSNAKLAKKYYVANPKYVLLKTNVNVYKKKDFIAKNKKSKLVQGTVVKVKKITKSSAGIPHLQLPNGTFITANKASVIKTSATTTTKFYTAKDHVKKVITLLPVTNYKHATGSAVSKTKSTPAYKIVHVEKIVYGGGTTATRFKTKDGHYITASKVRVISGIKKLDNYYTKMISNVETAKDIHMYNSIKFSKATKIEVIEAGTKLEVVGLVYNNIGYPRYKLSNGKYISTVKGSFRTIKKVVSDETTDSTEDNLLEEPTEFIEEPTEFDL